MDLAQFFVAGLLTVSLAWIKWGHTKALHESTQQLSADIHNNSQEFSKQLVMLRSVLERDVERDKKRFDVALLAQAQHEDLLRAANERYFAWSGHTAAEHDLQRAEDAAREKAEEAHEPVAEAEAAMAAEWAKLSAALNDAESRSIKAEEEYEQQRRDAEIWLGRNEMLLSQTAVIAFRSTLNCLAEFEGPRVLAKQRANLLGILRAEFGVHAVDTFATS